MENKITISFGLVDENGDRYSQESTFEIFYDLGDSALDAIGRKFNSFLKQCGYCRANENIFMRDITDEEYEALEDYLTELREVDKS